MKLKFRLPTLYYGSERYYGYSREGYKIFRDEYGCIYLLKCGKYKCYLTGQKRKRKIKKFIFWFLIFPFILIKLLVCLLFESWVMVWFGSDKANNTNK